MANGRLTERNTAIAAMLADGEQLKNFYRFIAQNPHINLHDACQIIIDRPNATVCYSFSEWTALNRRVTKGRKGIAYYDSDGYKQFVFDANDTHGDNRYMRPILPMKYLLGGLDELNGTELADDTQNDYRKIHKGIELYLQEQGELSGDTERDIHLIDGITYSLYSKTGFPKSAGINISGLPYSYSDSAAFIKEVYIRADMLAQDIEAAYRDKQEEVQVIDDTKEETVSDEPIVSVEQPKENKIVFSRSVEMFAQNYVILTDYKRTDDAEETHIYIGKTENLDVESNAYDNSDESLIYVTDRPQMVYLLYGKPYPQTQQELIDNGTFTTEDYAEYSRLKEGKLKDILSRADLKFGVKEEDPKNGVLFKFPDWQDEPKHPMYPLYKRYMEAQKEKPQAIVFQRLGDFYEVFDEGAKIAAQELDLTLTGRVVGLPERIPMCGVPYHAMDKYLDKILEHHGVVLLEDGKEPIYILSRAEALGQSAEAEEDKPQTELTELADNEPTPFDNEQSGTNDDWRNELAAELGDLNDEQSDKETEEAEIDEDEELDEADSSSNEQNEDDNSEQEEHPKVKGKKESTPKKPENGIKERKRKEKPQQSLFDLLEPQEKSAEEALIERQLKYGSGIEHGKFRIFDKYQENPTLKTFAEFLKNEYGWGGHGGFNGDDEMHDAKGIKMAVLGAKGEYLVQVSLKWPDVAVRIADLIDDDQYLTETEKEEYTKYKVEQNRLRELRAEEERRKNELIDKVIYSANSERKQRILDEYANTTKLVTFSEFLKNEYGTSEEQGGGYYAIFNVHGIWINKGEKSNDYQNRFYLNWNDFADKVCRLIENDRYIEQIQPQEIEQPRDLDAEEDADWDRLIDAGILKPVEFKPKAETPIFNRFKELTEKDRAYFESFQHKRGREPKNSPWGEVQTCRTIANGIYEVSTAGHGGVMVWSGFAENILSAEAIQKGYHSNDCYCYEEDCDACIPLRELFDKGILKPTDDYFTHHRVRSENPLIGFIPFNEATEAEKTTFFEEWNGLINRSLGSWNPQYWEARKQAEESLIALTPEEKIKALVDGIVKEGTEKTTDGNWFSYFKDFKEDERFVREHRHEIIQQLVFRKEVLRGGMDDDRIESYFKPEYCPNFNGEADKKESKQSQVHAEEPETNTVSIGDKFIYGKREVTVKELNGLYPNQVVIEYEHKSGELSYAVTQNIDLNDLIKNGIRVKDDSSENTDLNGVLDQSELGGAKTRFRNNIAAIRLVNKLYSENRNPTEAEKKVLSQFVGWGGLSQAFDENNPQWKKEFTELKALLSQEDYEQARGSTLNAYYTAKDVINGIYMALNRFGVKGNNRILEPSMGTGNFFGFMPKEIADGARLYGVELDNLTGRIAAKLYPQANVQIKGFEDTTFPNDKFDVVVGNVPFGGYGVADSDYNRYNFKVHDYFLAKSIDKVKPNGIVAIVTSKGTMDKLNPSARKYVAERAELLGAIRLPNTAFKLTAGTEAVADILFFRKREQKVTDVSNEQWLGTGKTDEGYEINQYFVNHPEMVLGTLVKDIGLYGGEDITVKPDGRELSEAIIEAVKNLPQGFYLNPETSPAEESTIEVDYNVKPMCYKAENGRLYMRVGDEMQEQAIPTFPKDAYQRIQSMIALREELHHILDLQIQGCSDEMLEREQRKLNAQYDLFVKRYGELNSQTNTRLFKEDGDSALLLACEEVDEDTKKVSKSDIFFKRTIRPYVVPTNTDDCFEALQISKNERGRVDISYIEELTGKSYDDVLFELGDSVFRNPATTDRADKYSGFETSEEYLSGKVVAKLNTARLYAEQYPEYQRNVDALEKVQPTPLTASEISVRLGQTWVDKEFYKQFYMELVGVKWWRRGDLELFYNPHDSSWRLDQKESVRYDTEMKQKEVYGTKRAPAYRLFIDCMNLKATTIYDTVLDEDGREKRVLNQAETIAAREKQNKIKEEFANWIFAKPERREELEATYNRLFNQIRLPSYDGSYLKFPEMNPAIELRPHQKNAIHRIITNNEGTLLHHVVGSGKTYTMAASIMKMRQLGLCKKAMVSVPNHLVQQWASEWRKLYPNAKILVATKEDLEKDNRQKFVSKVAMGDWDGIIIAQSSFAKIPVSKERQIKKLNDEITSVELTIENQWAENGMPRGAVKNLERIKKTKKAQLKKLMDDKNKDSVLTFENLGVDYLYIDEAHYYKNLFLFTKMNNVAGISNAASQRASDLKLKCEYLQELHGSDKGIVFATGTPISNSMAEMYTMQSYLQPTTLKESGIEFFDGWAADFGETITSMELAPSGQGYKARTRFAKFTNLPELLTMYRSFADVQTADMVKLNVPEAERHVINLKPSNTVIELAEKIAERAEIIHGGGVKPEIDNMLKVTSDGKKLALDPRCFVPESEDEEGSKLNEAAQRIYEIWEDTTGIRGTQIVFCDLSTPKVKSNEYIYGLRFDAYNDLKYKLTQKGIPANEIAFIHDASTDEQKQALFDRVNSGTIRVLIGSTEKCGAGTNVQKRLVALHHLDTPYRPSDMEQREGRIIRQGNTNEKVDIYTYVTERTFDSYSYQILENKQKFIAQINRGDLTVREAEDIDETTLSYAEIKAITAANPRIKRKMEVDTEIARLRVLEGQYRKSLYELQDKIRKNFPEDIRKQELLIERVTLDLMHLQASKPENPEAFEISVNGKVYTDRKEGGKALTDALYASKPEKVIAEYCGFKISMNPMTTLTGERDITLTANGQYVIGIGESSSGNLTRLDNFLEDFPKRKERLENRLKQLKDDLAIAEEQVEKPFEHKAHLADLLSEQAELNAELNLDKKEESVVIDDGSDSGDDVNYRMLPTRKSIVEDKIIDEEDKTAAMKVEVLPDYSITQDDMHDYGYKWDGMLPLTKNRALKLWTMGVNVCKLGKNDDHVEVDDYVDFDDDVNTMYGVEKPVWNNYLDNAKSLPYLFARLHVTSAVSNMISDEMNYIDDKFIGKFKEDNFRERANLEDFLPYAEQPANDKIKSELSYSIDEVTDRLWSNDLKNYGWAKSDIPKSIAAHIADDELKNFAKKSVEYLDVTKDLMIKLGGMSEEEITALNLPDSLYDELTVIAKQPDYELGKNDGGKQFITGLLLLRNEVTGEYYVINDTSARNKEGKELEVGDKTDAETLLAYNGLYDGNPLREFRNEREARVYYDEKVKVIRSIVANSTDYREAVISSVVLEYDTFVKEMLNSTTQEVLNNHYKVHCFERLSSVIEEDTEYFSDDDYKALYEDRGQILEKIYDEYIFPNLLESNDPTNLDNYDDTVNCIKSYCRENHSEIYEHTTYYGKDTENRAYYRFVSPITNDSLKQLKADAEMHTIAAPDSKLTQDELERNHIFYLNIGRDISEDELEEANAMSSMMNAMDKYYRIYPLYLQTAKYADDHYEMIAYRNSHKANEECKHGIDEAIRNNYDGMHLNAGFEDKLIEKYGMERVAFIVATTINEHEYDGRYSHANKEWAKAIPMSESEDERRHCCLNVHPAVLDGFATRIRDKQIILYTTLKEENENGQPCYNAYSLNRENGEISFLLGDFSSDLALQATVDQDGEYLYKGYTFKRIEPDKFNEISESIKNKFKDKEKGMAEEKYLHFTARGDKVLSITKDRNDRNIAIIQREKMGDFVVAAGYSTTDGTWAQGKYDFKTLDAAEQYRTEKYSFENLSDTSERKWLTCKVSPEALIKKYQFNSRFRMPNGSGYEGYAYSLFNDRIKEGTFTTDLKSDTRERALVLYIPTDKKVEIRSGESTIEIEPHDFISLVNGTMSEKYEREQQYTVGFPPEAFIKEYDTSMLLAMPNDTKYKGYVYYLPKSVISEDKYSDNGTLIANIGESFKVTLRKGEEKIELTAKEYLELVGDKKADKYKREPSEIDEYREQQDGDDKKWNTVAINESAVIANYENSTLFKMPKGDYAGFVYYIPSGMVRKEDDGLYLRIPEDFVAHLKGGEEKKDLTAQEFMAAIEGKTDEDYESVYRKPSEEAVKQFEKVEGQLRSHVPEEMLKKPNWVVVRTRENNETGRLDKFLINPHTGKFAESDNPETWSDFDTACKYAKENGGVCLAYALDGKDGIACIDLDGCMQENGDFSEIAEKAFVAASGSYTEKSVSGKGLHIFGKTKGADLRSFSKDKTMEYYQDVHFIAMTGDFYGSSELKSFDTPMMMNVLESKLEKRTEWKNTGKGVEGLSSMDDREMLDRAFAAKNGDTVKRLYNGEDLRGNRSNSDMSLMNYLAFWSNHDIDQMLRVFSTSGLYRPEKSQSYYEHTAIKAVKGTPVYNPPKSSNSNKPNGNGNGSNSDKGGK